MSLRKSRRWFLGVEPFFEGGWTRKGPRARHWNVEEEIVAVSVLGDVVVDLASARSLPAVVSLKAFALGRDVEVLVNDRTCVELTGRRDNSHVTDFSPDVAKDSRDHVVRIDAHTGLGDVTVRRARRA